MIRDWILDFAYYLHRSNSYQKKKLFFYNILENSSCKIKKYIDTLMIILVFISIFIFIREAKSDVDDIFLFFNTFIITFFFLIEYILRFWVSSSICDLIIGQNKKATILNKDFNIYKALKNILLTKLKFMLSLKAIIDLIAILPFFHELRAFRIFILFRAFKIFRYTKSVQTLGSVFASKKFEFLTLFIFAFIVIFISSVVIYVMESKVENALIVTFFDAIYWSVVTISTVGYGDISPVSENGKIVAMFVIVAGIAVFSFTTSLIVTSFTEKLDEIKNLKLTENISDIKNFYIICGYENVAKELGAELIKYTPVVVLEENLEKSRDATKDGLISIHCDTGSLQSYDKLKIDMKTQVKAVLCLGVSDIENVYSALTVRSIDKKVKIISILKTKNNYNKLKFAGVDEIIYEKKIIGLLSKELTNNDVSFDRANISIENYNGVKIEEIFIGSKMLSSFSCIGDIVCVMKDIVFFGIYKKYSSKFEFNPDKSCILEKGDYLLVMGNSKFIRDFTLAKKVLS